jgi:hypothetical protein
MRFDYWHIQRFLRIQGMREEEELDFGSPPIVIGNVVTLPEPIWQTVIATALAHGAPNVFMKWRWQNPLTTADVVRLLSVLRPIIANQPKEVSITYPNDLAEDNRPDAGRVIAALQALEQLLIRAAKWNRAVETWND